MAANKTALIAALIVLVSVAGMAAAPTVWAQTPGSYADNLSKVYEAPQFIRALKEGCDASHPESRAVNDAAYSAWRRRNKALIDELERRFIAMIRSASTDAQDYAKNFGKYEGEVLANRQELKEHFIAQGPQAVAQRCQEFPQYLRSQEADLQKRYEEELKAIRKRKS